MSISDQSLPIEASTAIVEGSAIPVEASTTAFYIWEMLAEALVDRVDWTKSIK